MLDEVPVEQRGSYRETLAHELAAPLEPEAREEYDREHWGLQPQHVRESMRSEDLLSEWERAEGVSA